MVLWTFISLGNKPTEEGWLLLLVQCVHSSFGCLGRWVFHRWNRNCYIVQFRIIWKERHINVDASLSLWRIFFYVAMILSLYVEENNDKTLLLSSLKTGLWLLCWLAPLTATTGTRCLLFSGAAPGLALGVLSQVRIKRQLLKTKTSSHVQDLVLRCSGGFWWHTGSINIWNVLDECSDHHSHSLSSSPRQSKLQHYGVGTWNPTPIRGVSGSL